jgi:hypothetical protein
MQASIKAMWADVHQFSLRMTGMSLSLSASAAMEPDTPMSDAMTVEK